MDVANQTHRLLLLALICAPACGCAQRELRTAAAKSFESTPEWAAQRNTDETGSNSNTDGPPGTSPSPQGFAASGWRPTVTPVVHVLSEAESPTLPDFEQLALAGNPTLQELQAQVDAAHGRWTQVGLSPNPQVNVAGQEIGNEGTVGQLGASVSQRFVTANKLGLNQSAEAFAIEAAEEALAAQRLRVLTDVRRSFYSLLVAQERVTVAEELHGIAQQAVERARQLVQEQEPKTVLTQAELEVELVAVMVENTRVRHVAAWRRLLTVCGQPDRDPENVSGELTSAAPQIVWDKALERVQRESPELAAAVARVEQSRWRLQRAEAQPVPDVTVQAGLFYDDGSRDPFTNLQLSMPIPVTNYNQGGIAEAQANVLAAERAVERVELNLQQRLVAVFARYDQARRQAELYDSVIMGKAQANLDLNRKAFDEGVSTYLPVLTAQRSYAQAKLARLNALEQLWSSAVEIEGLLLTDSLATR